MADLNHVAELLASLGAVSDEETLETVEAQDTRTGRAIRRILERAPLEIVHLIAAVARRAAELAKRTDVLEQVSIGAFDPRGFAESAEATRNIVWALSSDPALSNLVDRAVDELIERRVLGLLTLARLQRFLGAAQAWPDRLQRDRHGLFVADERADRSDLERVAESYQHHDPQWIDRALEAAGATIPVPAKDEGADLGVGSARSPVLSAPSSAGHSP